ARAKMAALGCRSATIADIQHEPVRPYRARCWRADGHCLTSPRGLAGAGVDTEAHDLVVVLKADVQHVRHIVPPVSLLGIVLRQYTIARASSLTRKGCKRMHCGVMVTGYNQGDWERLLAEDYSRPPAVSDAANMDDTLYLGELVEPLGFDSIWATEHYGSAYSMQPNPLQYLAYWAGRTARVDVGTAVIVAPWWNPVRLASEISMLDILLRGRRLHLGIGRGISPHEYASLGYPIGESHAYFYDV